MRPSEHTCRLVRPECCGAEHICSCSARHHELTEFVWAARDLLSATSEPHAESERHMMLTIVVANTFTVSADHCTACAQSTTRSGPCSSSSWWVSGSCPPRARSHSCLHCHDIVPLTVHAAANAVSAVLTPQLYGAGIVLRCRLLADGRTQVCGTPLLQCPVAAAWAARWSMPRTRPHR